MNIHNTMINILLFAATILESYTISALNPAVMSPLFSQVALKSHSTSNCANVLAKHLRERISTDSISLLTEELQDAGTVVENNKSLETKPPQKRNSRTANNVPASLYNSNCSDDRYTSSHWLHNMKTLPNSKILSEIKEPVMAITIWSSFVSLIHQLLLRNGFTKWAKSICFTSTPHSFLVSALGLLLVFRTNSAYQRFTEGREIWEKILSVSRNLSRMVNLYERDMGRDRKNEVFRLIAAFPYLLRHHIQPQCLDCQKNDGKMKAIRLPEAASVEYKNDNDSHCWVDRDGLPWSLFSDETLEKCVQSGNRPLWICDRLAREFTKIAYTSNFTSRERLKFLSHVDDLSQCVGACERIHQTAVPLAYARHSIRSLTLWLWTLPFAVINESLLGGWLVGPVIGAVAWVLFGVYQIGCNIEDPFQGSLRLNIMCDAVYRDVLYRDNSALQSHHPPESSISIKDNTVIPLIFS